MSLQRLSTARVPVSRRRMEVKPQRGNCMACGQDHQGDLSAELFRSAA